MKATEETVTVKHKENGIQREFTRTQHDLMGKKNRKNFKLKQPGEAGADANDEAEKQENQKLSDENARLRRELENLKKGSTPTQPEAPEARSQQQLENEAQRAENNKLQAELSRQDGTLDPAEEVEDETDSDKEDPNPALTALRKSYEEHTGKKPGRLGVDKMNEAIAEALKAKGEGPVEPK